MKLCEAKETLEKLVLIKDPIVWKLNKTKKREIWQISEEKEQLRKRDVKAIEKERDD